MNARDIRRRAFWIGFRSIWDLTGERTSRDLLQLASERHREAALTLKISSPAAWTYRVPPSSTTWNLCA